MVDRGSHEGPSTLTVETAISNLASRRMLERNGFIRAQTRHDEEDDDLILWVRTLSASADWTSPN